MSVMIARLDNVQELFACRDAVLVEDIPKGRELVPPASIEIADHKLYFLKYQPFTPAAERVFPRFDIQSGQESKMRKTTEKQILASRANGARSRGPKTPEGKKRSSVNALRHGFLARQTVLSNETLENFEALLQQHISRFEPADDIEHNAIEEMAGANWRHRRLWAMETRLLEIEMARRSEPDPLTRLAESWRDLAATPAFQLFDRYQSRLHCTYQRALQNLFVIRLQRTRSAPGFGPPQNQTNPATSKCHSLLQLRCGFEAETPQNEPGRPGKAA